MQNYILIDLSYFIFYRYYALIGWWKLANPDDALGNPIENEEFVKKFKKTFINKLKDIPKKLKIKDYKIIVASDCPRLNIWRHKYTENYKINRVYDDQFLGGPFFKLGFNIIEELKIQRLSHPQLEGDDCIAIFTKDLLNENPDYVVYIIANDMDYLQLASTQIKLINLKYKYLTDSKKWSGDRKKDLFCKIVMGDKSDDIPSIFKKCGPKTAEKYYENSELFKKQLEKEDAYERYEKNKKLIDFNEIPQELVSEFRKYPLYPLHALYSMENSLKELII
jgi:5'-3' exonuclease